MGRLLRAFPAQSQMRLHRVLWSHRYELPMRLRRRHGEFVPAFEPQSAFLRTERHLPVAATLDGRAAVVVPIGIA
jgi:hypothetical protein